MIRLPILNANTADDQEQGSFNPHAPARDATALDASTCYTLLSLAV
jgi:hypothetical protein